ncbi:fimbrial protein [Pseudomonas helleri]|uniref:Fimbrial protein n=1 Tax=Pseudomonas helleri TaxID=1608996 RepID=A0A6A7Z0D8_9PSED|nr:fimbrial protein [Pseudomonas helleri]MQT82684.1 fimbrial protein [Pseudomonas helleri]
MKLWQQPVVFAVCSAGIANAALANMAFNGTLIEPPPCTINSGNTVEIDFRDVGVNRIDGLNYKERVSYSITCSASTLPWEMVLSVNAVATAFDPAAVQSSVVDLGVRLLQDGQPFSLNTVLVINPTTPPTLEAVPVKRPGVSLDPGGFTATATLLAQYQ